MGGVGGKKRDWVNLFFALENMALMHNNRWNFYSSSWDVNLCVFPCCLRQMWVAFTAVAVAVAFHRLMWFLLNCTHTYTHTNAHFTYRFFFTSLDCHCTCEWGFDVRGVLMIHYTIFFLALGLYENMRITIQLQNCNHTRRVTCEWLCSCISMKIEIYVPFSRR